MSSSEEKVVVVEEKVVAETNEDEDKSPEEECKAEFKPVLTELPPEVEVKTMEENEDCLLKLRCKLYRFDNDMKQWKERGTGDVKILKHKEGGRHRILMRREKTFKICANHYLEDSMELKPNVGSDKSWVWSTPADLCDDNEGKVTSELLAIRFGSVENAQEFKKVFEAAKNAEKKE